MWFNIDFTQNIWVEFIRRIIDKYLEKKIGRNIMTPEQKEEIDKMSYEKMLMLNRYEPSGSKWFTGETGEYFLNIMAAKKPGAAEHTAISKKIGWDCGRKFK